MFRLIKRIANYALNPLGLEIRRYTPEADMLEWLRYRNIQTVLDIGANAGQFAKEIRKRLPEATIYSFEPVKKSFDQLVETMNGDTNFKAFHCAIGEREGIQRINVSNYSLSSSLLTMAPLHEEAFPHTKGGTVEETSIRTLDNVAAELPCRKNILIKIDVQGYEGNVIRGGEKTIRECEAIIVETSFYPLYESQPLFADVYEKLSSLNFKYTGNGYGKKHPRNREVISDDSFFVRKT